MKKQALLAAVALVAPVMLGTGVSAATNSSQTASSGSQPNTPVTADFTVSSTDATNPTPPSPATPGAGGAVTPGNKPLNPTSTFAVSYLPSQFSFGSITLTGQNTVNVPATTQANKTFNVGIKNTTHRSTGWTLRAQLTGDLANYGAKVTTTTSASSAKLNNNGNLTTLPNGMITVTQNAQITSTPSTIMTGNNGHVFAGTYDLNLGSVSLNIPDTTKVPAGQATGQVNWNLTQTP
ncbi:hypothetical protein DF186_10675 [Enterococcus hirae]|uniref:WxL domain-containing protein n=1 Tax=Enterococcus hirae TaxID=1354 RepID=UPI000BA08BD2|nr:WxL domain-containing protein [Enterococcus hirae]OZS41200.1 hypothetical protein CHB54_00395 [Enterococcus hirae]PWG75710.1 hypothetical protein DF186_10675 [Enterococcus hirae]